MNAERLFNIVQQLNKEVRGLIPTLDMLLSQLQQATNSPNEQNQRNVDSTWGELRKTLKLAPSDKFSPGIREDMRSLLNHATLQGRRGAFRRCKTRR